MKKSFNKKKFEKNRILQGFSPFVIFGVAIILVPIFVLMTMDNIREQNQRIIEKLTGKGIFLIRAFEAGTRTGMMTMSWNVSRVQNLLIETALQPEVEYIMITDVDGTILAHSDQTMVGERYENMPDIKSMKEDALLWHREIESENGKKVFQVFKRFTPSHRRFRKGISARPLCIIEGGFECGMDFKPNSNDEQPNNEHLKEETTKEEEPKKKHQPYKMDIDWFRVHFMSPKHSKLEVRHQNQIIFAALDMSEVEIAKTRYLRHVIAMGFMFFVLGCTGVVGIIALQGYRSARTSITELKDEIERSRRLAAVGKLAAGVAHEIRNPLSSIKGLATYFKERYCNVKDDIEVADVMIQEVERLNRAVTQLLEFAKPFPVMAKEVNLKELITHSVKLIEYERNQKDIKITFGYKLSRENITTDPDRLNQILLNLYLNAMQAMEQNGELTIKVSGMINDKIEVSNFNRLSGAESLEKILIEVADTGKGIDQKDIEHIFDPYFTNRPGGTGLGLAMVHRAVEALGGDIWVESELGKGTTFFINLPILNKQ